MHPVMDQPPPLRTNPYAGKRRRRRGPLPWVVRWLLIYFAASFVAGLLITKAGDTSWATIPIGLLFMLRWVAGWAFIILFVRLLWQSGVRLVRASRAQQHAWLTGLLHSWGFRWAMTFIVMLFVTGYVQDPFVEPDSFVRFLVLIHMASAAMCAVLFVRFLLRSCWHGARHVLGRT